MSTQGFGRAVCGLTANLMECSLPYARLHINYYKKKKETKDENYGVEDV